jgi:PadR family transcriptional regulator
MSRPSDLVQGTLDLLILKILALEPLNGWAIGQRLRQVSKDVLQVSDGSLYPALHKLRTRAGSRRNGVRARTIAGRSSTR